MLPNPFPSTYRIGEDGVTYVYKFCTPKKI